MSRIDWYGLKSLLNPMTLYVPDHKKSRNRFQFLLFTNS
ncbi:hypothetical protein DYBT9623_04814 [Dyadobacter sp. CECT 9623]|uniref:Transposase n=1 Tax=Dyadobacter linearis TaxID=2823330 RepID=A0ABM8UWS5_9BACT|nr:hypothetical protein DYBT9623_04814 [Dyadobacter sp. CECT 9623]